MGLVYSVPFLRAINKKLQLNRKTVKLADFELGEMRTEKRHEEPVRLMPYWEIGANTLGVLLRSSLELEETGKIRFKLSNEVFEETLSRIKHYWWHPTGFRP